MHKCLWQRPAQPPAGSWWILLLLACYLAVRGFVPAGFMPAPLSAGAPYDLCHGDSRSALVLAALSQQGHGHDHAPGGDRHHDAVAEVFADNHCGFSASAGLATAPVPVLPAAVAASPRPPLRPPSPPPSRRHYLQPPSRAPPVSRPA